MGVCPIHLSAGLALKNKELVTSGRIEEILKKTYLWGSLLWLAWMGGLCLAQLTQEVILKKKEGLVREDRGRRRVPGWMVMGGEEGMQGTILLFPS